MHPKLHSLTSSKQKTKSKPHPHPPMPLGRGNFWKAYRRKQEILKPTLKKILLCRINITLQDYSISHS